MRTLMLMFLPLGLTACAASTAVEPALPPSLLAPCADPQALPERALTRAEVEILWGRDRSALRDCAERGRAVAALKAG